MACGLVAICCIGGCGPVPIVGDSPCYREPVRGTLYPFRAGSSYDSHWGYIDRSGRIVVPPILDDATEFVDGVGVASVYMFYQAVGMGDDGRFFARGRDVQSWDNMHNTHCCFMIDAQGKIVMGPFLCDYPGVGQRIGNNIVMVERTVGAFLFYRVSHGYINLKGKWVHLPDLAYASPFSEGLAKITRGINQGRGGTHLESGEGFIDITGKEVIPCVYTHCSRFSEGLAAACQQGKYGFIDKKNTFVIAPQFDAAWAFSEGLAEVTTRKKAGFIDKTGRFVIPPQFAAATYQLAGFDEGGFSEGLAVVAVDKKAGYVNRQGRMSIEPRFQEAASFHCGRARVRDDYNHGWYYIDTTGKRAFPGDFKEARDFKDGIALVNDTTYIDTSGKTVFPRHLAPPDDAEIGRLIEQLRSPVEYTRSDAAELLGLAGPRAKTACQPLTAALSDPSRLVKNAAMSALVAIGNPGSPAVDPLAAWLGDADETMSSGAAVLLARIGQPSVKRVLVAAKGSDEVTTSRAINVLGDIGPADSAVIPALIGFVKGPHEGIRIEAAKALGKMGPAAAEAIPAIEQARKRSSEFCGNNPFIEALANIRPPRPAKAPQSQPAVK